ncbi:MAG: DUF4843 domain-containing protein [Rikenellaceae bacterium]|nr:DUF4843 domain-containing protein [Rikenellaceae bacterium]
MKKSIYKYLIFSALIYIASSCEKTPEVYDAGSGLNFYYTSTSDTLLSYSFVYGPSSMLTDTVWVKVETMGPLSDRDREITIVQQMTGKDDAVAGTHYVSFNDASLKKYYFMRANRSRDSIPVVLKRDGSLKENSYNLMIRIESNKDFKLISKERNGVRIVLTDQLARPSRWAIYCSAYFGDYGPVKHKWMIEQTGKKWDDDYLNNVLGFTSSDDYETGVNDNYDGGYCSYLSQSLVNKLSEYNAGRLAQGLDVLKEADGTVVAFQ